MFKLFSGNRKPDCPIDEETRIWMEGAFTWLVSQFGKEELQLKQMLLPIQIHFPVNYNGTLESVQKTGKIVAKQMNIDFNQIDIQIYQDNIHALNGDGGFRIYTETSKDLGDLTGGLYIEKNEYGQFVIGVEKSNLTLPEHLVAVLAHEFSHIKLLGENRISANDESLTDLATVVFGLGIFSANSSFLEIKTIDSYGHKSLGYLTQREWGYALALYAYFRNEVNPSWVKFLKPNLASDFKKSSGYIFQNQSQIFKN